MSFLVTLTSALILALAKIITAARGVWRGVAPVAQQRVYFVNHNSHGDFILVWAVLPPNLRVSTRPVAGSDYWMTSKLKRFIGRSVFNAVLIDRNPEARQKDPIETMTAAIDAGDSLILFPEGTRNITGEALLPFKSGLFHLATARPDIDLVPVWIDNLNRVLPKGAIIPIPLICTVTFGDAMRLEAGEAKGSFLQRAEAALLALRPAKGALVK
ncbi:MAG: 1-acyl-sn-glycerol-3-phosphate acyltransferase [Marinosulfonomonas sp.]|nr:1-acyl-sn-glycerol-3-phosphate acyltransferase [Marinosulfonomonas sp.]